MNTNTRRDTIIFNLMMFLTVVGLITTSLSVFLLVIPIIDAIYTYRNGIRYGILFSMASPLFMLFLDPVIWMLSITAFAFLGVTLGYYIGKKQPHEYAIFAGLITSVLGIIITVIGVERIFMLGDISDGITKIINNMEISSDMLVMFNTNNGTNLSVTEFKNIASSLMPSVTIISLFFYIVLIYILVCAVLKYVLKQEVSILSLSGVKLPGNSLMGAAIIVYGGFLLSMMFSNYASALYRNSIVIGVFVLVIQGAATAAAIIRKAKLPSFLRVTLTVVSLALLQVIGLGALGFLDALFDVRKLRPRGKPRE